MPVQSDPWEMLDYMQKLYVVVFIEYASIAILIFDYLLTSQREIELVWAPSPWNIGRILFFLTRYTPFVGGFLTLYVDVIRDAGLSKCATLTQSAVYFTVADIIIAEIILTMRVYAIWHGNRKVTLLLLAVAASLASIAISRVAKVEVTQNPFGEDLHTVYGVCPPYFAGSNTLSVCYMVLVSYETVILTLTLIKAAGHYHQPGSSSFINLFFTDGLSYNFFILACSVANIIVRYKTSSEFVNLLTSLQPVIHSVLTSRMMLHLKQSAVSTSSQLPSTRGSLRFARNPRRQQDSGETDDTLDTVDYTGVDVIDHSSSWFVRSEIGTSGSEAGGSEVSSSGTTGSRTNDPTEPQASGSGTTRTGASGWSEPPVASGSGV
ncbi:hypothetical protein Moror_3576 [Moniliophthora roreri MCA 2997]|uniref:DUF6533 domain-containing protein n=1 Tax=Moniliophthora roreri (strain MCA 2997) TaxID=1381753 RepID=V2Y0J6_MONRO|nr:hypothetical protein Moror_3576 [Moniliophthora roreri MCA 2997]